MARTLSRKKAHRTSLIRNLATSLFLYESIVTTKQKAIELKRFSERIISKSKNNDLNAKRYLESILFDKNSTKKMIDEIINRYESRESGFVRILNLGPRAGDNANMAIVELVDKKVFVENKDNPKIEISSKKNIKNNKKLEKDKIVNKS